MIERKGEAQKINVNYDQLIENREILSSNLRLIRTFLYNQNDDIDIKMQRCIIEHLIYNTVLSSTLLPDYFQLLITEDVLNEFDFENTLNFNKKITSINNSNFIGSNAKAKGNQYFTKNSNQFNQQMTNYGTVSPISALDRQSGGFGTHDEDTMKALQDVQKQNSMSNTMYGMLTKNTNAHSQMGGPDGPIDNTINLENNSLNNKDNNGSAINNKQQKTGQQNQSKLAFGAQNQNINNQDYNKSKMLLEKSTGLYNLISENLNLIICAITDYSFGT